MKFKQYKNAYTPLTHYTTKGSFKDKNYKQVKLRLIGSKDKNLYYLETSNGFTSTTGPIIEGFKEAKQEAINLLNKKAV